MIYPTFILNQRLKLLNNKSLLMSMSLGRKFLNPIRKNYDMEYSVHKLASESHT